MDYNLSPGDIDILREFYYATNGLEWSRPWNISSNFPCDDFQGVFCSTEPNGAGFLDVVQFDLGTNNLVGSIPESIYEFQNLTYFGLNDNKLHGTISEKIGQLTELTYLDLYYNKLSGSLPAALSTLSKLSEVVLNGNKLSGKIEHAFNPEVQTNLVSVYLQENQLTGTIPRTVTALPRLNYLSLSWNCFHGSIPESLCNSTDLLHLYLTGANSAPACRSRFISYQGFDSYLLKNMFSGEIPQCLLEIPSLMDLYLDGLGITAKLPSNVQVSPRLNNLVISNNALYGTIPMGIQTKSFDTLDLSYNKLSGTLVNNIYPAYDFYLRFNRLTGFVPNRINAVSGYQGAQEILEGNSFDCNAGKTNLPQSDLYYAKYQDCGSSNFNTTLYESLGVTTGSLLLLLLVMYVSKHWNPLRRAFVLVGKFRIAYHDCMACTTYYQWNEFVRRWVCVLTAGILVLLIPLYVTLSMYYATQTYKYAWVVSGVYLNGVVATVCMLCVLLLLAGSVYWSMMRGSRVSFAAEKAAFTLSECWSVTKVVWLLVVVIFVIANILIVVSVNTSYIAVTRLAHQNTVQKVAIAMSVFKIVWSFLIVRNTLKVLTFKSPIRDFKIQQHWFTSLETGLVLFNNIVAPYIAMLFASESCLQEAFVRNNSFAFMYSFQCSSAFITTYASVFLFMFALTAVGFPVIQGSLMWLHNTVYPYREGNTACFLITRLLSIVQPKLLFPEIIIDEAAMITVVEEDPETKEQLLPSHDPDLGSWKRVLAKRLFCADLMVVDMVSMFAIVLTFGAVVPAVAFLGCFAVLSQTLFNELMIGRGIHKVDEVYRGDPAKIGKFREELLMECRSFGDLFKLNIFIIVPFLCVFYGLLVFDMLGDTEGTDRAIWAPVVVVCMLVGLSLVARYGHRAGVVEASGFGGNDDLKEELRQSYAPLLSSEDATLVAKKSDAGNGEVEVNPLM